MFRTPAVFVLGAGASWHYGYPTGEELVKKVLEKARYASRYFQHSMHVSNDQLPQYLTDRTDGSLQDRWRVAWEECQQFEAALEQVSPLVIDYFLGWNPRLRPIGKLLIAWVILECEKIHREAGGNINRKEKFLNSPFDEDRQKARGLDTRRFKDNWCRFIIHKLAINCEKSSDLLQNDVQFVTFNYDVSLELALYQGLQHIQLFQAADVEAFFARDRIVHIYGSVRTVPPIAAPALNFSEQSTDPKTLSGLDLSKYFSAYKAFLDPIYTSSKNLLVIDPLDKETDKHAIEIAATGIAERKNVYILGYGFDVNNSKRLDLGKTLHYGTNKKFVRFTNFNDTNRVNKQASRVFFGNEVHLVSGMPPIERSEHYYYEKSIRDVYEALEFDLELVD